MVGWDDGRYSDLLWAGQSEDWILVGVSFSASIQTGSGAHPASYTVGTGSFLGVKWLQRGVDHAPPFNTKVKERVELYICSPSEPLMPVLG
jgi:hypothetical protein